MKVKLFLSTLFILFVVRVCFAQIPSTINYQGVLKNADGTVVSDGKYILTFNIYESEESKIAVWAEKQTVSVTDGIFNVILGSVESLRIPFDKQYWLGISVNEGSELMPRTKLTSVPYSLSTRFIPDNIVTTGKIANGAVTPEKISTSGASSGQSLIFNGKYVVWDFPSGAGFTLPYSDTTSSSGNAFSITNSGSGGAGYFTINNAKNTNSALYSSTNGAGRAGYFTINNPDNPNSAIYVSTNGSGSTLTGRNSGTGHGGYFGITNTKNNCNAIYATTNGTGAAIYGSNSGSGSAGIFSIDNPDNSSNALIATTNGKGAAGYFNGKITATNVIESTSGGFKFPDGTVQTTAATGGEELTLPYEGTTSSSSTAFSVTATGEGKAGHFQINNAHNSTAALWARTNGTGYGGYFQTDNSKSSGHAIFASTNGSGNAVYGYSIGTGSAGRFEIINTSNENHAIYASTNGNGHAIYATTSGKGYAGYFDGNVRVTGSLSKGSGSFLIDHPLDPENKILRHSFVESPEMMNIYKGRAKLKDGKAVVILPDYFDALNHPECREINLTPVNGWSPLFLEGEIKNNQFLVKTTKDGNPEQEFSWIIYANRNDEFAKKHPIVVEEEKGVNNTFKKGEYIHPDVYYKEHE